MAKIASDFPVLSDVIKYEDAQHKMWGRNLTKVTVNTTAQTLEVGTLLGKVTASGKYVVHAPAASDGSQNAVAVVAQKIAVPATTDTQVLVYGGELPYQVQVGLLDTGLVGFSAYTAPQKAAAIASLGAKGFQVITGVNEVY